MGKSKGYQPQISLNKKEYQDSKLVQSFSSNNQNLINFNAIANSEAQNKAVEVTAPTKRDLISFTGNETPSMTTNSKKPSEFDFINNRKTNSTQNIHSNLIDINSDSIPVKLKVLHENINKLYSNNDQHNYGSFGNSQNLNNAYSSLNSIPQQNINIHNSYPQPYENPMNNQMGMGVNNIQVNTGYNPYNTNQYLNNSFNNQNNFNNYNATNNLNNMNGYPGYNNNIPQNNFNNQGNFKGNYQGNMSFNDYTFGLTPSIPQTTNYYINLTDEKGQKAKSDDPFKNLVSFK
jgi:hypothetical protein